MNPAAILLTTVNRYINRTKDRIYSVPFFSGKYDLTVNIELAKTYLKNLQAPVKGFYTFNHSAHSPMFEEPDRLMEILVQDVLNGTNNLADKNFQADSVQHLTSYNSVRTD